MFTARFKNRDGRSPRYIYLEILNEHGHGRGLWFTEVMLTEPPKEDLESLARKFRGFARGVSIECLSEFFRELLTDPKLHYKAGLINAREFALKMGQRANEGA